MRFSAAAAAASLKPRAGVAPASSMKRFSAAAAAASLKLTRSPTIAAPTWPPVFRGRGRGLIEATRIDLLFKHRASEVFRGRGRGLIEARPRSARRSGRGSRFSAAAAAASLKHARIRAVAPGIAEVFRGRGRGLIEARAGAGALHAAAGFSAAAAAASLKPMVSSRRAGRSLSVFRGRGRGLIEARRAARRRTGTWGGFPRPRPRPH